MVKKKYLMYYNETKKAKGTLNLNRVPASHRKHIGIEEWKGTPQQKGMHKEVYSKIVTGKPRWMK